MKKEPIYMGTHIIIQRIVETDTRLDIPFNLFPKQDQIDLRENPPQIVNEPVTVVTFDFTAAGGSIPTSQVGMAAAELCAWVNNNLSTRGGPLKTHQGIIFSGRMISVIAFALGHATHAFRFGATYEPRINGGYVGHDHSGNYDVGTFFFLPENVFTQQ